ncbi:hypothetical protein T492DRAFT_836208 [Pavlovales sp. CCMP2436]|nr:hypothetical protein T492DRAFT_836208 [Pavlovales sp. CCMP2436]
MPLCQVSVLRVLVTWGPGDLGACVTCCGVWCVMCVAASLSHAAEIAKQRADGMLPSQAAGREERPSSARKRTAAIVRIMCRSAEIRIRLSILFSTSRGAHSNNPSYPSYPSYPPTLLLLLLLTNSYPYSYSIY